MDISKDQKNQDMINNNFSNIDLNKFNPFIWKNNNIKHQASSIFDSKIRNNFDNRGKKILFNFRND